MTSADAGEEQSMPRYRIGMAARLSGVAAHNLRKWESRYGLIEPQRTPGGERMYTPGDVEKLIRARRLVDAGMDISEVARLPEDQLNELLEALSDSPYPSRRRSVSTLTDSAMGSSSYPRVVVIGDALRLLARQMARDQRGLHVIAEFSNLDTLPERLEAGGPLLLLLEQSGLHVQTVELVRDAVERTGAQSAIVFYKFASQRAIDTVTMAGFSALPIPMRAHLAQRDVLLAWGALKGSEVGVDTPEAPRFSDHTLAAVSGAVAAIACECPQHIAQMLLTVQAFERYRAEGEVNGPEDAELHRNLRESAAFARVLFEDALVEVARVEGIDLAALESSKPV